MTCSQFDHTCANQSRHMLQDIFSLARLPNSAQTRKQTTEADILHDGAGIFYPGGQSQALRSVSHCHSHEEKWGLSSSWFDRSSAVLLLAVSAAFKIHWLTKGALICSLKWFSKHFYVTSWTRLYTGLLIKDILLNNSSVLQCVRKWRSFVTLTSTFRCRHLNIKNESSTVMR